MKKLRKLMWMFAALPLLLTACSNADEPDDFDNGIVVNDGTKEKPFIVSEVIAGKTGTGVYVKGYIVGCIKTEGTGDTYKETPQFTAPFENATNILIAESKTENNFDKCVPVQLTSGAIRTIVNLMDNAANLSKEVVVKGNLIAYFKKPGVKETDANDFTMEGYVPPVVGATIFSETFATSQGAFSIVNVVAPTEVPEIWRYDSKYFQMKAGAFVNSVNYATESWLISPAIDLTGKTKATLTFEHAGKQFGAPVTNLTVQVSTVYTTGVINAADWTQLTIPNHLSGETNTFKSSGEIDLTPYCGKSGVRVAFKYVSTSSNAGNWYIKNVKVTE